MKSFYTPCSLSPFPFLLLAFPFLLSAFSSCSRLPNVQGKGEIFMQGIWDQEPRADISNRLNFTQHHLKITCDSFYLDLTTFAKVNYYADSCFNQGIWKEYAKGTYRVSKDTVLLNGTFTKANYKQKVSGCYRIGRYMGRFKIVEQSEGKLKLESLDDQQEINLTLKQKLICIPKEL